MAINIELSSKADSLKGNPNWVSSSSVELNVISDVEISQDDALDAVSQWIKDGATCDEYGNPLADDGIEISQLGSGRRAWSARVRYETPRNEFQTQEVTELGAGIESYSASLSEATTTRSLNTVAYPLDGSDSAPDFGGLIGWDGERFTGCSVAESRFRFNLTYDAPLAAVKNFAALATFLDSFLNKTNSVLFLGFAPGCVKLVDINSGNLTTTPDGTKYWRNVLSFEVAKNAVVEINGRSIPKPGWDYLWTLTKNTFDSSTNSTKTVPVAAYVERVYERADFNRLFAR